MSEQECQQCKGRGRWGPYVLMSDPPQQQRCPKCQGKGKVPMPSIHYLYCKVCGVLTRENDYCQDHRLQEQP